MNPKLRSAPTVLVGVGAGIAAYKVAHLVRGLRRIGCEVFVLPTRNSLNFVGLQTWQELSENPVGTEVFHGPGQLGHIELARRADLIIIAPCTANLAAKIRVGSADDFLTATVLASQAPKLLVPAMHSGMWENPATEENFAVLAARGMRIVPPGVGALSSGDSGVGRMAEPDDILIEASSLLDVAVHDASRANEFLAGRQVVVSAGGTAEPLDPVRYLGNYSSGRQGIAIAEAAAAAGAKVTLLAAKCEVPLPQNPRIEILHTPTAREMENSVQTLLPQTDILIMAAAVADYRPEAVADQKLKKSTWGDTPVVRLIRNPDILRGAANSPHRPSLVVGFAAETGDENTVLRRGKEKANLKGADLIAINRVGDGRGFGDVDNDLTVVTADGELVARLTGDKRSLAEQLLLVAAGLES